MNNKYEEAIISIRHAERALDMLKEYTDSQHKTQGETMLEQIIEYVYEILDKANYMCVSFKTNHLSLSEGNNKFIFHVYGSGAISSGYPIFIISTSGDIIPIRELNEGMMLTVIKEWDEFKQKLDAAIQKAMEEKTKRINSELSHIGYVNEELSKWHI